MKRYYLFILLAPISYCVQAQTNTFPSSGNVGIGTTSPGTSLHVVGTGTISNGLNIGTASGATGGLLFAAQGGDVGWQLNSTDNNSPYVLFLKSGTSKWAHGVERNSPVWATVNDAYFIYDYSTSSAPFYIKPSSHIVMSRNVGIGTSSPAEKLEVNGNIKTTGFILTTGAASGKVLTSDASGNASWQTAGSSSGWALNGSTVGSIKSFGSIDNYDLPFITNNTERMRIASNGNVGIGTTSPSSLLAVNGTISSKKVKVTQTGWPDYVFQSAYRLRPLDEVEQYIHQYHHLPEIASAEEIEKNGVDLGENQAALLQKVEELTLYIINLNKEVEALKKTIGSKSRNN